MCKKTVQFHIMHSMKGGCGKSTCALFKALQLSQDNLTEPANVLFLDADFRGSAMQPLLFREKKGPQDSSKIMASAEAFTKVLSKMPSTPTKGDGLKHMLALPDNYRPEYTLSLYLKDTTVAFGTIIQRTFSYQTEKSEKIDSDVVGVTDPEMKMNGYIDMILSAAASESKEWFRYGQGKITAGIFVYRMRNLLESILCHNKMQEDDDYRGQYSDVVIDMPPGYDEYSDILLELLHELAKKHNNIKLHYYAVTTEDIGHITLTKSNIRDLISDSTGYKAFDTVNVILSCLNQGEFDNFTEEDLNKWKGLLGSKGKIYQNIYASSFHAFCRVPEAPGFEIGVVLRER